MGFGSRLANFVGLLEAVIEKTIHGFAPSLRLNSGS
jgi:hypothetical protein